MEEYPIYHYYRPQTKLREGNVFTPVCDSVHGGRGSLSGGKELCPGGSLSRGVSIQEGSLSKGVVCVQGAMFLSGRPPSPYSKEQSVNASYWNAFLLKTVLTRQASNTMMSNPLPDKEITSCIQLCHYA